ncbi:unnamed protein product, partial [Discosporangium mesarthrocarpum]
PLVDASLEVGSLSVCVTMRQYTVLNEALSAVAMSRRRLRFRRERPKTPVLDDPEAWWRYAGR